MAHSLAEFDNPDGSLNTAALVQATALLVALQNGERATAQSLLDRAGPVRIVAWFWDLTSLPPNRAYIVDGDTLYCVIVGTQQPDQWTAQIAGATGTPYPPQPSISAGAFWLPIANAVATEISTFADPSLTRMKIVGHSYGGAVALLVALNFAQNPGNLADLQTLLIAAPNPLTSGYVGPLPRVLFRVQHPADVVPQLPPAGANVGLLALDPVEWAFGRSLLWSYYGRGYFLDSAGELSANPSLRPTLGQAVGAIADWNLGVHYIGQYATAATLAYGNAQPDPTVSAWLPDLPALIAQPDPQTPPPPIPQSAWVNVPGANTVYFAPGVSLIQAPALPTMQSIATDVSNVSMRPGANISQDVGGLAMATFSGFVKCTGVINNGRYGRLMSFVLSGQATLAAALPSAKTLFANLASCFGNSITPLPAPFPVLPYPKGLGSPVVEYLRLSDALNPRVSQLFNLGGQPYAGYFSGLSADFFSTALSIRLPGLSTQTVGTPPAPQQFVNYGNLLIVGQPDDAVKAGQYVPGLVLSGATTLDTALQFLLNLLSAGTKQWGFMGLDYSQPQHATSPWTVGAGPQWVLGVLAHGYSTNDRVKITGSNSPGFNGTYRVIKLTDDTFSLVGLPRTTLPAPTAANVRRVQLANGTRFRAFYRYQVLPGGNVTPFGIKISKKNPGKEFTGVSFRRRPRKPHI